MFLSNLKLPAWIIVLWLVSMQVIAPFIHAHVDADKFSHSGAMHVHPAVPEAHHGHDASPSIEVSHGPHQIVSMAKGLLQKFKLFIDIPPAIILPLLLMPVVVTYGSVATTAALFPQPKHRSPQPQAPPAS
ncbi:hypothetical protein MTYP_01712 [Methylophilaceae bacterium]|nr:hypothetical protein MTYP_01712 [Methylophilaceae bacterium]